MSVNHVIVVGRLGADPELRKTTKGQKSVCQLSVATSYRGRGDSEERVEWHRVVVWERQAENCAEFLTKGQMVGVEGRLATRQWSDAEGATRYTTEIVAARVSFLGKRQSQSQASVEEEAVPF